MLWFLCIWERVWKMKTRIKEIRKQKAVTQRQVAIAIGCSVNNYSRYERGEREPDIYTLKALSKYFEVSIDYILFND